MADTKATPRDTKVDPMVTEPPSYTDATSATSSSTPYGDGNVFTDLPRPTMTYSAARREPYQPRRKGWSYGFFDCLRDPASTAKAVFCPCVSYAQTRHRLHSPNTPAPVFSAPCLGYCLVASAIPGAEFIFGFLQRGDIRNRLAIDHTLPIGAMAATPTPTGQGIRLPSSEFQDDAPQVKVFETLESAGGFMDDVLRHFFCTCCSLAQEDREVRRWEQVVAMGEGLEEAPVRRDVEDGETEEAERLLGDERA
ncbi:uncharacterized protein H6S33_005800 [Morchella sextelata]|uniref:uncharacterized protein n=1 Tax=Morchella sextelata TaxID=1174677 RepID=UPI001D055D8F|nr:uncharacterized protein H6S33_005800 [Morchella sextelata]KAH0613914.1 hypothetical protein H6S33_005800 [Morchella sextelata]